MKRFERRQLRLLLLAAPVLFAACSSDTSDLQQFVAAEKAKPPGPIEPLPQIQPYETFVYQAQPLRSPFVPDSGPSQADAAQGEGTGTGIQPDFNRNKEYLEQFPLDALAMVGTIEAQGDEYALVSDPDGAVHRVELGNFLGQNHGKIIDISQTDIEVTEIIPDGLGGWRENHASIGLDEQ